DPRASGTDARGSATDARGSATDAHLSGADARGSATDAHVAGADVGTSTPPQASGQAAGPGDRVAPVAGLTVIHFRNTHMVYAITWYTLALMVASAIWLGIRNDKRA